MEGEHKLYITETQNQDVCREQTDRASDNSQHSGSFSYKNICELLRKYIPCTRQATCGRPQNNLLHEEVQDEDSGCRKAHCLSSYYSVFVARLAIMVMLAILIGLLTILTWHFTTVYTTKSIKSLAYDLRFELLQRPISRMWNIFNATLEITMAQVKLTEYVVGQFPPPLSTDRQVQLYEVMKDVTWALFASRRSLNSMTISYNNGHVQAFDRDRRNNSTFYIFSEPANTTSPSSSRKSDDKEGMSNAPILSWNDTFPAGSNSSIWYREPLDPHTGEKDGPRKEIPSDDLINIAGISQIHDGDTSWHVTVSKFTDSPLLSSASPVRHPTEGSIVAVVGVRTALSSVGQLMKELVELHSGYMYLTSQEGFLLATSTNAPLLTNTTGGPKLMMAVESNDSIIKAGAEWLQKEYGNGLSFSQEVHVENVVLGRQRYYIDSFFMNLTRLPLVGVIIIPRSFVMGKVDQRGHATLAILISASIGILVIGCVCILILTSGVSKEMKLRAELISHLDARRQAEASSNYKSQFLANMSHELRTPMAAVIGLLDILLCDEYLTTEQIAMVSQIRHCSTSLLRLLNNILDLSKVESGKLVLEEAKFDLGRELEGLVDMFSVQCDNHNIEIVLDLADDMPRVVQGDSARVVQIFANLLSNSIKFTSSGHILLRGWCENSMVNHKTDEGSEIDKDSWFSRKLSFGQSDRKTSQSQEKLTLWFEVEDTGCGIDPSKWESVFESFVQADLSTTRTYGGTGLGLCIVRSLVNKMGGQIMVIQKEGPGTLMRFYLVFSTPAEYPGQLLQHLQNEFGKDPSMVLLALHGNISRLTISQWLKENGIQAYEASNWNELTETLSMVIECNHHQGEGKTDNDQSEYALNHWFPKNECGSEDATEDSIPLKEERVLRRAFENQLLKSLNLCIIIDAKLLDMSMNAWKDQLAYLERYWGRVKIAWLLNYDTSASVKLELRRLGYSIMVNRPLYKSKVAHTLTTMMGGTKHELEKPTADSGNFQLITQEGLDITSYCQLSDKDSHKSARGIQQELEENSRTTLCHAIQNIPKGISSSRSLNSSVNSMNDKIDFLPRPIKEINGLMMPSEILTKSGEGILQNERENSSKKSIFNTINNGSNTEDCYESLDTYVYPKFHSRTFNEDSPDPTSESKSLMVNSTFKQYHGHVQLASEEKKNTLSQHETREIPCTPSSLGLSSTERINGSGLDKLELLPSPSLNHENGRSNCIDHPTISDGFSNPPVCPVPSNGISKQKPLEGIRILLAEDTPVLQRVATIMLEKMGATVVSVGDGLQAVDVLKNVYIPGDSNRLTSSVERNNSREQVALATSLPFDLVLMDCQMPKMDGYEATKAIRRAEEGTNHHIPIVALTAHAMSSDEAKCLEVGMDAYLTKPINCKLMASTILALTQRKK